MSSSPIKSAFPLMSPLSPPQKPSTAPNLITLAPSLIPVHCVTPFCSVAFVSTPKPFPPWSRWVETRGGWEEGKIKARGERSPRSCFLSPALPLPFFSFTGIYLQEPLRRREMSPCIRTLLSEYGIESSTVFVPEPSQISCGRSQETAGDLGTRYSCSD